MLLKPDADDTGAGAFPCVHILASFTARRQSTTWTGSRIRNGGQPRPGLKPLKALAMKQVLTHACRPASFGWGHRLLAWLRGRGETHRAIGPKPLSDHILHDIGLSDDARGDQLYGMARRRW